METEDQRLRLTYRLTCAADEQASDKARGIALEQTAELPARCLDPSIESAVVGRIESLEPVGESCHRATISYSLDTIGGELPQLLNLLFGNISLKRGILLEHVDWPATLVSRFAGPRFGVAGLRELCGETTQRPLVCTALKPMGLDSARLAELCRTFVRGGADLIKDDHSLANQPQAPFAERVPRCQEVVATENARRNSHALYFPNLCAEASRIPEQLEIARAAGCRGVLLSPWLCGPDVAREVANRSGLAVLAHPSMTGAYFQPDHGIAPDVLLGQIFRLLGADGVIYPNVGGRFPFTEATCRSINTRLRQSWEGLRPSFPVPGGGIDVKRVPHWIERYGRDTIFLIGGSLYGEDDLEGAVSRLVASTRIESGA